MATLFFKSMNHPKLARIFRGSFACGTSSLMREHRSQESGLGRGVGEERKEKLFQEKTKCVTREEYSRVEKTNGERLKKSFA